MVIFLDKSDLPSKNQFIQMMSDALMLPQQEK